MRDLEGGGFYTDRMIKLQRRDEVFEPGRIAEVLMLDSRFVFCGDDMRGKYADLLSRCMK